ncbi:hypothetical protein [Desulfosporosinus sp.]|uniref:hypothetical protein n=1 Tax=Desulfosporosinus sp. TaxID=157907 RepID=UPI0025C42ED8|nr:hypothetical protein [Desulfosporosinus sp.]MBC2723748.1 hypothetical protein [Desulfosporosinus sp.]MBC2727120.1 hypothetical protein [Desulfosporosinus sp.]
MNQDMIGYGFALVILCLVTVAFVVIISQVFKNSRTKIATAAEIAREQLRISRK